MEENLRKVQLIPELIFNNVSISRISFDGVCWIDVESVEEDAGEIMVVNLRIASWGEDALAIFKHIPSGAILLGAEEITDGADKKTFVKVKVENPTNYAVQLSVGSEQTQPAPKEIAVRE